MIPSAVPQSKEELKCELYPKNAQQLWNTYQGDCGESYTFYDDQLICDAIERTHDIVHEEMGDIHPDRTMKLPSYVVPKDKTAMQALLEACKAGLVKRGFADQPQYIERLRGELGVIKEKNFAEYFLTMKAIMDLARDHMLGRSGARFRGRKLGELCSLYYRCRSHRIQSSL